MADTVFTEQCLFSDRVVGFRNGDDEIWQIYHTEPNGAVISFAPGANGYAPKPEWVRRG